MIFSSTMINNLIRYWVNLFLGNIKRKNSYLHRLCVFERKWGRTVNPASHRLESPLPIIGWITESASSALFSHSNTYASQWYSHFSWCFVWYGETSHSGSASPSRFLQVHCLVGWKSHAPSSHSCKSRTWYWERFLSRCTYSFGSLHCCRQQKWLMQAPLMNEGPEGGGGRVGSHFPVIFYEKSHSHLGFFQNSHSHFKRSIL